MAPGPVSSHWCQSKTSKAAKTLSSPSVSLPVFLLLSQRTAPTTSMEWLEAALHLPSTLTQCSLPKVWHTVAPTNPLLTVVSQPVETSWRDSFAWPIFSQRTKRNNYQFAQLPKWILQLVSLATTGTLKVTTILAEFWLSAHRTPNSGNSKSVKTGINGKLASNWTTWPTGHLSEFPRIKLCPKIFPPLQSAKI